MSIFHSASQKSSTSSRASLFSSNEPPKYTPGSDFQPVSCIFLWVVNLYPYSKEPEDEAKLIAYNGLCVACELQIEVFLFISEQLMEVLAGWKEAPQNAIIRGWIFFFFFIVLFLFICCWIWFSFVQSV
jgi:hypothetical protein